MPGIFIAQGMTVAVPSLVITMGEDGKLTSDITVHVHFDVCPTWLELARRHLADAKLRQAERVAAWTATDEQAKANSLEREFEASMQAIMAAAIAFDAFYAGLRDKAGISKKLAATWREKKTARHKQIAETIRIAFNLKPKGAQALHQNLKEQLYRMRDAAVHPPGNVEAALLHPELGVGVEWRFAWFRYENAEVLVRTTLSMLSDLVTSGKARNPAVQAYSNALRARLGKVPR